MRASILFLAFSMAASSAGCKKADQAPSATDANAVSTERAGCDHELESRALAKHSWPYPADYRNLRWQGRYNKIELKLKPVHAAFVTATVTLKQGDLIEVEDSEVRIIKPRRLIAKRDLFVTRKEWNQGIEVEKKYLAAAKGELGSFLFYNSQGLCMIEADGGPGWTQCTLDDAFEGLSAEDPEACEQVWWIKIRRSKVTQGWTRVPRALVERIPPGDAEAK